jgi:3-phenylpropionate/trans-cinnamate dioxygenase ferredoxin subunit
MSTLKFSELLAGKPVKVIIDGRAVCVARVGDEVFAIDDTCSHSDASLSEGEVSGFKIECWLHGAEFDLRTGEALTLPATVAVQTYEVNRDGDNIAIYPENQFISASKEES